MESAKGTTPTVGTSGSGVDIGELTHEIAAHIAGTDAEFGIYVRHLSSGAGVEVNADALYLMASTFKVPILIEALAQVHEGHITLEERIELTAQDQLPTSMILGNLEPGLRLTLRDLLTAMIISSDNTATDMVLRRIGIDRVARRLRAWGLDSTGFHLGVQGLFDEAFPGEDGGPTVVEAYRAAISRGPILDPATGDSDPVLAAAREAGARWDGLAAQRSLDNNVTSPRDMGTLLERLAGGDLLPAAHTHIVLDIMLRQQLNQRLARYLPVGVPFAHKTGTFYASHNDVGILYLPDGGRVIIAVYTVMNRERMLGDPLVALPYTESIDIAMGRIARSVYDAFTA